MKYLLVVSVALCGLLAGCARPVQADYSPRPRFERLLQEEIENSWVAVWHDRESGIEFICAYSHVYGGNSVSCFPTGRNWKVQP